VVEDVAHSICSFYLVPEDGKALPGFLPGQFLTFRLDIPTATGGTEQIIRCYSLSDAPRADSYRVSIKRVPASPDSAHACGRSSNHFHDQVEVGSLLQVRAPSGHFHIDRSDAPVVLIGGGIGITPMLSMLDWLPGGAARARSMAVLRRAQQPRDDHEVPARIPRRAHPNFHLRVCFSDPLAEDVAVRDYQHRSRVDVHVLRMQLPLKPYHYYICGPTPMMESPGARAGGLGRAGFTHPFRGLRPGLHQAPRRGAGTGIRRDGAAGITVNFAKSGKELNWQPAGSLLDFAEANGIAVNSGCRAGGCGSCQTTIRKQAK
jgi:ferredoxin-NADP reductase